MRITVGMLHEKIETVKAMAERANLTFILPHSGARYSELWLRQENGTVWLCATNGVDTGAHEVGTARGNREVARFLDGLIVALDSMVRQ